MSMTTAGMKAAILAELEVEQITVEEDAAFEALARAIVTYIQQNASVIEFAVDPNTGFQTKPGIVT